MSIFGAPSFKSGGANNQLATVALGSGLNTSVGDLIVVGVSWADANGRTITSVTDTAGNTYVARTKYGPSGTTNNSVQFFDCLKATHANAANIVTANFSGNISGNYNICAWDVSVTGGSAALDAQSGQAPGGASPTPAVPAFSTTGLDELVFLTEISASNPTASASAGFTLDSGGFAASGQNDSAASHAAFSTVQTNITPGFTNPANQFYAIGAISYKGTASAGGGMTRDPLVAVGDGSSDIVTLKNPSTWMGTTHVLPAVIK